MEVLFKGNSQVVSLKGMEGNVDLVQGRGGKQQLLLLWQQGAVGGEDDFESGFSCNAEKLSQMGMQQRFAHQMKIQKISVRMQLRQQGSEFLHRHGMLFPLRSGAKSAV